MHCGLDGWLKISKGPLKGMLFVDLFSHLQTSRKKGEHWCSYELLIPKESFAMGLPTTVHPGLSRGELKGSLITLGTFLIG